MVLPTQAQFKRQIQSMDAGRFEQFVADVWRARGWTARVTQDGSDRGVDVIATKTQPFNQKEVIQAKRYSADNPVGSPQIQQYASLRQQENADTVVVVTSGRFSKQAEELARQLNVKLIDGNSLYNLVKSEGLDAVVSEYLATDSSGAETNSTGSVSTAPQSSETPASTKTDQQGRRTGIILIAVGIIGVVALVGLSGVLLALSIQDSPEAGGAVENSPSPTQAPVSTPTPTSTETAGPTATPTSTPTPTPTASVSEVCPTLPDTTAQGVRPTGMNIDYEWRKVESDSVSEIGGSFSSVYTVTYETPDSQFALLKIYNWNTGSNAEREADDIYESDSNFQAWIVRGQYSFAVQVYERFDEEIVLLSDSAVEPAKLLLSNVGGVLDELGTECVNRTVNLNT